ncbi:hypothetical protein GWI33_006072 [Rhynchophorus ferrugineus]|uniref:Uncharacterized protein n=1 Tax=Rhynchophorus ferrugineus TaxID=354439 RepID=A0A834IGQ3_RHYFE|nr:hypothetical protein GWI33_006072 [Rhynchophorus ferrugineus]
MVQYNRARPMLTEIVRPEDEVVVSKEGRTSFISVRIPKTHVSDSINANRGKYFPADIKINLLASIPVLFQTQVKCLPLAGPARFVCFCGPAVGPASTDHREKNGSFCLYALGSVDAPSNSLVGKLIEAPVKSPSGE